MAGCADRKTEAAVTGWAAENGRAELLAANHVTGMMYLEQRARQGEDSGGLAAFRRHERRQRETAGFVVAVDMRFRVFCARRCHVPRGSKRGRHCRAPATRRRAVHGRSRSGRGSPPGDSDESDPDDDHFPSVVGDTAGVLP